MNPVVSTLGLFFSAGVAGMGLALGCAIGMDLADRFGLTRWAKRSDDDDT